MPLMRPTTTPMPDEIFDYWAPRLGEAELKVLLYIVRRTLGFKKDADAISLTQFIGGIITHDGRTLDAGCGVKGRANVVRALKGLSEKGLIRSRKAQTAEGDSDVTVYRLWWQEDQEDEAGPQAPREPEPRAGGGSVTKPPWFRCVPGVVSQQNHRGSAAEPTTNSLPTNSTQETDSLREGAAPERCPSAPLRPAPDVSLGQRNGRPRRDDNRVVATALGRPSPLAGADSSRRDDPTSDAAYRALVQPVRAVGRALGDATPRASITRAYHLLRASGLGPDEFVALLDEAAAIAQAQALRCPGPFGGDQVRRLMPYCFGVLERLVDDRAAQCQVDAALATAPVEETHPIWRAALAELREVLTAENYTAWLAPTRVLRQEGTHLSIGVRTSFQRAWLAHKLQGRIEQALARCGYPEIDVTYVLVPADAGATAAPAASVASTRVARCDAVEGGGSRCSPA